MPRGVLLTTVAAALTYVASLVYQHTIAVVEAKRLLLRWDAATHLITAWTDHHYLVTGQIHLLLADLWMQGYWPPMHSIFQIPFFLIGGPGMAAGLSSSLAAFVLAGVTGVAVLWRQWRWAALLPAAMFAAMLMTSPFLLAYASVTMTEMVGALAQLVVLLCWLGYWQRPEPGTARLFAISLTLLFFTKYNYFLLLVAPLVVHEWLERTRGARVAERTAALWRLVRGVLTTRTGALIAAYLAAVAAIMLSGGFEFHVWGRRVTVHSIGNTGHVVLYILLARLWYLHRKRRLPVDLTQIDPRTRAVLIWFVVPVTIWFASPFPNHIKDFFNLVINRPQGEPTVGAGVSSYLDALRTAYFSHPALLVFTSAAFGLAAARYRRQPPLMRWLILAIPFQFAAIALHQTRYPRFLLLTVVLLCLAACGEVAQWLRSRRARLAGGLLAASVLTLGVAGARNVVTQPRFRVAASEHFTDSPALRSAIDAVRADLGPADRLAVVGQSNDLSPSLLKWELGPPSGGACFPFWVGGRDRPPLDAATRVLLITPLGADRQPLDVSDNDVTQRREIEARADRGDLVLRQEIPIEDQYVVFRLYGQKAPPTLAAPCW